MEPIGSYSGVCSQHSPKTFLSQYSYPFLLHCNLTGPMVPTDRTRGWTVDRLVLADEYGTRGEGIPEQEDAYTVFGLAPRNPRDKRITIGCSSTCDVQINDESVSTLHAILEKHGKKYRITDQESAAGTQVNEEMLQPGKARELATGDQVTLGYLVLTFLLPEDFYTFVRRFFGL